MRQPRPAYRKLRGWMRGALIVALLFRALLPTGFMPASVAGAAALVLCSGTRLAVASVADPSGAVPPIMQADSCAWGVLASGAALPAGLVEAPVVPGVADARPTLRLESVVQHPRHLFLARGPPVKVDEAVVIS